VARIKLDMNNRMVSLYLTLEKVINVSNRVEKIYSADLNKVAIHQ